MESPSTSELESQAQKEELFNVLQRVKPETGYTSDREKQKQALENFPADICEKLRDFVSSQEFENNCSYVKGEVQIYAWVMEELVKAEVKPIQERLDLDQDEVTKTLLQVLKNPQSLGINSLNSVRNPDLVYAWRKKADGSGKTVLVIEAIGEVKTNLNKLQPRTFEQLRPGGFQKSLQEITNKLSKLSRKQSPQVEQLKQMRIELSPTFRQYLYVPANADVEPITHQLKANGINPGEKPARGQVILEKSVFSSSEIGAISRYLTRKSLIQLQRKKI